VPQRPCALWGDYSSEPLPATNSRPSAAPGGAEVKPLRRCRFRSEGLGGHFTLKRYHSEKAQNPDGTWQHTRIVLSPDTTAEGYEPIVIEASGDEEVRVIAEWLGVVGG
jgi:hypothetical protein